MISPQRARLARRICFRYTGNTNMAMGAFTHSLYAMKEAVRHFLLTSGGAPVPFGQPQEAWQMWAERVEGMGIAIMRTTDAVYADNSLENDLFEVLASTFPATNSQPFSGQ